MKKTDYLDWSLKIFIVLGTLVLLVWFIQLMLGGSPTFSQFNTGFIILFSSFLVKLYREMGEVKIGTKYSFNKVKEDTDLIKKRIEKMDEINLNLNLIKKKLKI